jgi:hypothetical protein
MKTLGEEVGESDQTLLTFSSSCRCSPATRRKVNSRKTNHYTTTTVHCISQLLFQPRTKTDDSVGVPNMYI